MVGDGSKWFYLMLVKCRSWCCCRRLSSRSGQCARQGTSWSLSSTFATFSRKSLLATLIIEQAKQYKNENQQNGGDSKHRPSKCAQSGHRCSVVVVAVVATTRAWPVIVQLVWLRLLYDGRWSRVGRNRGKISCPKMSRWVAIPIDRFDFTIDQISDRLGACVRRPKRYLCTRA